MQILRPIQTLELTIQDRDLRFRTLGNQELLKLSHRRVAIIGSRKASSKALGAAEAIAKKLVNEDVVIVSGGAPGIDQLGHRMALSNGGSTIIVLAQGLETWIPPVTLEACWDWSRVLAVSEWADDAPWLARQAFARNVTIARLSQSVIAVAAECPSGSMNMIRESAKMGKPLFVPMFQYPDMPAGNSAALDEGMAKPLFTNRVTGPNIQSVLEAIEPRTCVVNVHLGEDYDVYIGRGVDPRTGQPSEWGNDWSHKRDSLAKFFVASREDAIMKHRLHVLEDSELQKRIRRELKGKRLGCFCKTPRDPNRPCHGDIYVEIAEA